MSIGWLSLALTNCTLPAYVRDQILKWFYCLSRVAEVDFAICSRERSSSSCEQWPFVACDRETFSLYEREFRNACREESILFPTPLITDVLDDTLPLWLIWTDKMTGLVHCDGLIPDHWIPCIRHRTISIFPVHKEEEEEEERPRLGWLIRQYIRDPPHYLSLAGTPCHTGRHYECDDYPSLLERLSPPHCCVLMIASRGLVLANLVF